MNNYNGLKCLNPNSVNQNKVNNSSFLYKIQKTSDKTTLVLKAPRDFYDEAISNRPERKDELWLNNCFEFFLKTSDNGYREYNFAPNGHWQCYDFKAYREERSEAHVKRPVTALNVHEQTLSVTVCEGDYELFNIGIVYKSESVTHYLCPKPINPADFHLQDQWITFNDLV